MCLFQAANVEYWSFFFDQCWHQLDVFMYKDTPAYTISPWSLPTADSYKKKKNISPVSHMPRHTNMQEERDTNKTSCGYSQQ